LTLKGGWNPSFSLRSENPALTVIDGGNRDSVFDLREEGLGDIDLRLISLTVTHGNNLPGGGISIYTQTTGVVHLSLYRCAIQNNTGGGIGVSKNLGITTITLDSCEIKDNITGGYGAGLDVNAPTGNVTINIENSIIADNHATHKGGGIRIFSSTRQLKLSINYSTITANTSSGGNGLYLSSYGGGNIEAEILNSIVWGNGAGGAYNDLVLVRQNITMGTSLSAKIYGSDIGVIVDTDGLVVDMGDNRDVDPLFRNPAMGDYHLSKTSPLIDQALCGVFVFNPIAGLFQCRRFAPEMDFEGDLRPLNCQNTCDIGADEFIPGLPSPDNCVFFPVRNKRGKLTVIHIE
jgi:hypothetical protein